MSWSLASEGRGKVARATPTDISLEIGRREVGPGFVKVSRRHALLEREGADSAPPSAEILNFPKRLRFLDPKKYYT